MNKAQAIQIIREEYQNGYSPTDITQNLSQQLNAPFDLVYKFVMQTLGAELQAAEEPIPPPSPLAQPEPVPAPIPGYEMLPGEEPGLPDPPSPEPIQATAFSTAMAPDLKALEQNPKVEKFVLQMLMTHQKNSDTVLAVCERTGLGWDEAKRLVSHVAAKNHKMLQARLNRLPMILSTLALLVGMLMVYAGINEAYNIYTALRGANSGQELVMMAMAQEFLRSAVWSMMIGSGLLIGGAVGLFIALSNQFS